MKLQPSEVTAIIKKEIANYDGTLKMESVGSVIERDLPREPSK